MEDDDSIALDMCPVCKSTPLTTPGLRFKIAPRCYHRICEGCVDRKFSSGKSECPISGCKQQLWKRDWKMQTFEDLQIEREVDIRRRVMRSLDRMEEEFETKRDYDDFLEMREEMVMNLVLKTDVAATNRKLREIEEASGIKPRTKEESIKAVRKADGEGEHRPLIKGLKKVVVPPPKSPYDPFMGMSKRRDYYELKSNYDARYNDLKKKGQHEAAGYDFQQYMDESLLRAFAGFGVFIEEEMSPKQSTVNSIPANLVGQAKDDVF